MMKQKGILRRITGMIARYKGSIAIALMLSFISSLLGVFNILAFIPVLDIIFGTGETPAGMPPGAEKGLAGLDEIAAPIEGAPSAGGFIASCKDFLLDKKDQFEAFAVENPMNALYLIAALIISMALLRAFTLFISGYIMNHVSLGFWRDLQRKVFDHVVDMDLHFFQSRTTGNLMARAYNDVKLVRGSMMDVISACVKSPVNLVVIVATLIVMSPTLSLVVFVMTPATGFVIAFFGKRMRHLARKGQRFDASVIDIMQETFSSARVVKAFGMEEFEKGKFWKATQKSYRTAMKRSALRKISSPIMEFLGVIGAAVVLVIGGHLILKGSITSSVFFAYLMLLTRIYTPLKDIAGINLNLQNAVAGGERVFNVLDSRPAVVEQPDAAPVKPLAREIRLDGVSFSYTAADGEERTTYALEDVSYTFAQGKVYAVVGRSGAGKTTLINLLCRFYDPTRGTISYDDVDYRRLSLKGLRDQIAIVPQETLLFNDTIRNNIAYGRSDIPLERVVEAAKSAYAHDFISEMPQGYETLVGERGSRISGGQKQRIAIARAVLKNPSVLILDEATSSLDTESERLIQQALERLIKGKTVFVIAHRLSTVKRADEIVVLDKGKITEHGTHERLLTANGLYANLCRMQDVLNQVDMNAAAAGPEQG